MIKIVLHIMIPRPLGMWEAFIPDCRNAFSYFACGSTQGSFLTFEKSPLVKMERRWKV